MGFLRGIGLGLTALLLFLTVALSGLAVNVSFTVLSPSFVKNQIEKLDLADVIREEVIDSGAIRDMPHAVSDFLNHELPEYSAELKQAVADAVDRFYDYLLGSTDTLDLPTALGETVLNTELLYSLADRIDWPDLAEELVQENIQGQIDPVFVYLTDYVDDAMIRLNGWFKNSLRQIVDPLQEYLLGQRPDLRVSISLGEPASVLYQTLFEVYNRFPPPELNHLSPLEKQLAFDEFFFYQLTYGWPNSIDLDATAFEGTPESIATALDELNADIAQAKDYVNYFRLGMIGLLLVIAGLAGAAWLILRDRHKFLFFTGLTLFVTGLVGFVTVMVTNAAVGINTDFGSVPSAVHIWLPQLVESSIRPYLFFSILIGAVGITGIIMAQINRPRPPSPPGKS